jgi:hypothetical protein
MLDMQLVSRIFVIYTSGDSAVLLLIVVVCFCHQHHLAAMCDNQPLHATMFVYVVPMPW